MALRPWNLVGSEILDALKIAKLSIYKLGINFVGK